MGIKLKTPRSVIERAVRDKAEALKRAIVTALSMIGEECINVARDKARANAYITRTGNLASSIGYMIVQDGEVVTERGFEQTNQGAEGVKTGKKAIAEVAKQFPTHSVLIVVAGMNYAIYVERKGYDVLTQAKLHAKTEAINLMKDSGLL